MNESGAVGQHIREYVGYEADGSFGDPQLAAWADQHDADDRRLAEEATRREELLAKLTDGTTVLMDKLAGREALLRQCVEALERIETRGRQWLLSNNDYATPYADRPEGDRVANSMYEAARAALAAAQPESRQCDATGHYYALDATSCYCGNTGIAAQPESEEVRG